MAGSTYLHGRKAIVPVDSASDAFDVCVCKYIVGVGSPLHTTVEVGRPSIRHESIVSPDVDQRSNKLLVSYWLQDLEQGSVTSVGIPQSEDVVIIGLLAVPTRIFARLVRGDHDCDHVHQH